MAEWHYKPKMGSYVAPPPEEDYMCTCGHAKTNHRRNIWSCMCCPNGWHLQKRKGCRKFTRKDETNEFVQYGPYPDNRGKPKKNRE